MKYLTNLLTVTFMLSLDLAYGQTTPHNYYHENYVNSMNNTIEYHFTKSLFYKGGFAWDMFPHGYYYKLWQDWQKDIKFDMVARFHHQYIDVRIGISEDSFNHYKKEQPSDIEDTYNPIAFEYSISKASKNIYLNHYNGFFLNQMDYVSNNTYTNNFSSDYVKLYCYLKYGYIRKIDFNSLDHVINYHGLRIEERFYSKSFSLPKSMIRHLTNIREAEDIIGLDNQLPIELWYSRKKIQTLGVRVLPSISGQCKFKTMRLPNLRLYKMFIDSNSTSLPDYVFKASKLNYLLLSTEREYNIKESNLLGILSSSKFSSLKQIKVLSFEGIDSKIMNSPKLTAVLEKNRSLHHIYCIEIVGCGHISPEFVRSLKPYKGLIIEPDWSNPDMVEAIKSLKNLEYLCIRNCPDSLSVLEDIVSALPNLKTYIYEWCNRPIETPEYYKGYELADKLQEKYPHMKIKTCLDVADLP